jgi:hypothetical protein
MVYFPQYLKNQGCDHATNTKVITQPSIKDIAHATFAARGAFKIPEKVPNKCFKGRVLLETFFSSTLDSAKTLDTRYGII